MPNATPCAFSPPTIVAHESEHEGNADSAKMLADLAAAHRETMRLSDRKVKVARIRITDAGRRALEGDIRGSPWYLVAMIRFDRFQLAAVGGYAMAEVEREDLTAAEFAVLAAIVEMNEKLWCWIDRWHV